MEVYVMMKVVVEMMVVMTVVVQSWCDNRNIFTHLDISLSSYDNNAHASPSRSNDISSPSL